MKQNMEIISMDVKAFDALAGHVEAIERKAEALCRRQEKTICRERSRKSVHGSPCME